MSLEGKKIKAIEYLAGNARKCQFDACFGNLPFLFLKKRWGKKRNQICSTWVHLTWPERTSLHLYGPVHLTWHSVTFFSHGSNLGFDIGRFIISSRFISLMVQPILSYKNMQSGLKFENLASNTFGTVTAHKIQYNTNF